MVVSLQAPTVYTLAAELAQHQGVTRAAAVVAVALRAGQTPFLQGMSFIISHCDVIVRLPSSLA